MNTERVVHKLFMYTSRTSERRTDPALNSLNSAAFRMEKLASWWVKNQQTREVINAQKMSHKHNDKNASRLHHLRYPRRAGIYKVHTLHQRSILWWIPLGKFMYLVFTRMPRESCRRRLGSQWLCLCDVFWELIIKSFLCWFCTGALGLILFQILIGQSRDLISDGIWPARSADDTLPSLWINWRPRPFCRGVYDISPMPARGPLVCLEFFGSRLQKYISGIQVPCIRNTDASVKRFPTFVHGTTLSLARSHHLPWYNRTGWLGVKHQLTQSHCWFILASTFRVTASISRRNSVDAHSARLTNTCLKKKRRRKKEKTSCN